MAEPDWIRGKAGYFIGMSGDKTQEAAARQEAIRDVQRQIIVKLGMKVEIEKIEKIITTGSTKDVLASNVFNQEQINVVGKSILKVSADEYYVEKLEKSTPRGIEYFYKAWAKVRFLEDEHKILIEETVRETISLVETLIKEGSKLEIKGKYFLAMNRYKMAAKALKEINDMIGLSPKNKTDIEKIEIELKNLEKQLASKTKIIVAIEEIVVGRKRENSIIENRIIEALKEKSFTLISKKIRPATEEEMLRQAKNYGANILVSGKGEVQGFNKKSDGLYGTHAQVIIKIFSIEEDKILAIFDIPDDKTYKDTRGFGRNEQEAAQKAFSLERAKGVFDYIAESIYESSR